MGYLTHCISVHSLVQRKWFLEPITSGEKIVKYQVQLGGNKNIEIFRLFNSSWTFVVKLGSWELAKHKTYVRPEILDYWISDFCDGRKAFALFFRFRKRTWNLVESRGLVRREHYYLPYYSKSSRWRRKNYILLEYSLWKLKFFHYGIHQYYDLYVFEIYKTDQARGK